MPLVTLKPASCAGGFSLLRVGVCLLSLSAPLVDAHAAQYLLDLAHTRVHWEVRHFGTSTTRGRFDDLSGSLVLDPRTGMGEVSISIAVASVSTGVGPLNAVLRRDYLSAEQHPQAYFVASGWRWKPESPLEVRGELTLRGVSRPVVLRSNLLRCYTHPQLQREVCGADLEAELQRSDFGIHDGLPFIGDRVRLLISVEAIRQDGP